MRFAVALAVVTLADLVMSQASKAPAQDLTWSQILKQFALSAAEGGPVMAFSALLIGGVGYVLVKVVWPWLKDYAERMLAEVKDSKAERRIERETDLKEQIEDRATYERTIGAITKSHETIEAGHESAIQGLTTAVGNLVEMTGSMAQAQEDHRRETREIRADVATIKHRLDEDSEITRNLRLLASASAIQDKRAEAGD